MVYLYMSLFLYRCRYINVYKFHITPIALSITPSITLAGIR